MFQDTQPLEDTNSINMVVINKTKNQEANSGSLAPILLLYGFNQFIGHTLWSMPKFLVTGQRGPWYSSLTHHQLCASIFPHSKTILDYFPLVERFVLMRGTFLLEEFLFEAKLREIFWMLACDLAISARWVVTGTEKGSKSSILLAN